MSTVPSPSDIQLVHTLADRVKMCSEEVEEAQKRLELAKQHYQNVLDAHSFALGKLPGTTNVLTEEKNGRLKREDYYIHVLPFLAEHGPSHFRDIHVHLKTPYPHITESQVNKFLNKDAAKSDSRIMHDQSMRRGGYFMLKGDEGTPSVGQSQEAVSPSTGSPSISDPGALSGYVG